MVEITCVCGATYTPKDANAIKRHAATAKHQRGATLAAENNAFDEAQREQAHEDGWDDLEEAPVVDRKVDHDAGHVETDGGGSCEWCVAEEGNTVVLPDEEAEIKQETSKRRNDAPKRSRETSLKRGEEQREKQRKSARVAKAAPKPISPGDHKVCRTCSKDKPLTDYRRKASRPDGVDTNCRDCSKAWLVANNAKKAAKA